MPGRIIRKSISNDSRLNRVPESVWSTLKHISSPPMSAKENPIKEIYAPIPAPIEHLSTEVQIASKTNNSPAVFIMMGRLA